MAASARGRQYLAWQLRQHARLERGLRAQMRRELFARYRAAANGYARDRIIGAENALRGHEDAVSEIVREHAMRAVQIFGPAVLDSLKGEGAFAAKDFSDDYYEQLIREWLISPSAIMRIGGISKTTRGHVRAIIERGLVDGQSVDAIARAMRKRFSNLFAGLRAHVVARTEVHNAASFATDAAARASGIDELEREWVAVNDDRTRDEHAAASGQRTSMQDPFTFTTDKGETYVLKRPGDPEGPPNGTIMCRCAVAFHPQA